MNFARPLVLLLLVIPVTIAFWEWIRRGHPLVMPFDHGHQRRGRWLAFPVNAANTLAPLLLAVAIVILAGPQRMAPPEKERVMANILFCLDLSASMRSPYGRSPSRYDAAVEAIDRFISMEDRQGDTFGLTVFGNEVLHWVPVTSDLSAIRLAAGLVTPKSMPYYFGGTQIGKALLACKTRLAQQEEGDRLVILLSDGVSSDLRTLRDQVVSELSEAHITVYFISLGGMRIQPEVERIARHTGGRAFQAPNPQALKQTMEYIDLMQKAQFKEKDPLPMDRFRPFARAGLVLVGLQALALFGVRYTPW